jgi:carboxymethylenebutenolidase
MTALVTISDDAPGITKPTPQTGFRAAVALYPGCGMEHVRRRFAPYAPVLMLIAAADDEVSPAACRKLAARSRALGAPVEIAVYDGAQHDFDDPGRTRQGVEANRRATADARRRATGLFATALTPMR